MESTWKYAMSLNANQEVCNWISTVARGLKPWGLFWEMSIWQRGESGNG